ncbi:Na+/H+ antiporter subunit A [Yaniella flava]|uniref:Na+/H+ antiporter subunit A n=1 Tax=Yaniella flava TaxID=287930 RepID=A0ABP5G3S7_9MICC
MLIVLLALFLVALVAPVIIERTGRSGFLILAAVPAAGFVWLAAQLPKVLASEELLASGAAGDRQDSVLVQTWDWIPRLGVQLSFRLDTLSAFMGLIVLGVGAAVLVYCARYFLADERRLGTFGAQFLAFAGAMFGLVVTDDLMVLFVFWEITTILSFLMIGYQAHRVYARRSATTALIVTTFGGLAMLIGLVMLGHAAGTYRLSEIIAQGSELLTGEFAGSYMTWAIGLVLLGAITKSAQVPFHFWLPAAMAAPTPVSAYLHAAAMVKAGVYLVARFAPAFAGETIWHIMVLGVGMWTMLVGGWRALRQTDIKLILAYGTVSQLGFLMIANGLGTVNGAIAGLAMLLAHSLFKAPLFMVVGAIDKITGTRDLNKLSGLRKSHAALFWIAAISSLSMAGVPPLFGFVAKETVLQASLDWATWRSEGHITGALVEQPTFWGAVWSWAPLVVVVLGSILTVAYTARFMWASFAEKKRQTDDGLVTMPQTRALRGFGRVGMMPAALLAAAGVIAALVPGWVGELPFAFGQTFTPVGGEEAAPLALWHGFSLVLGLSMVIIVGGLLLFTAKARISQAQQNVPHWIDAAKIYRSTMAKLDDFAVWVTGRTQRGDLSFYLYIILAMTVLAPISVLLFPTNADESTISLPNAAFFGDWMLSGHPVFLLLAVVMILAAIGAIRAKRRFWAVLLVSTTGYGLATIFAFQGSPDLALTQVLVESVLTVAMVLGLRVLPPNIPRMQKKTDNQWARALLAIGFGLTMMWVAATVMASRMAEPISIDMPDLSYNEGGGTNIVNVTLVDMRAWDTFGEITVLAAVATGIASLVFIAERDRGRRPISDIASGTVGRYHVAESAMNASEVKSFANFFKADRQPWIVAGATMAPERRSIIFEVITRLIFHAIILVSLYLLIAGHNLPGGGFAGGLLAGIAFAIRYLTGGRYELEQSVNVPAGIVLGSGLAIAAIAGVVPLFFGGQVFQAYDVEVLLPLFGHVHFASAMVFDVGVYLVVIGLVLDVLRSLGSEVDSRHEIETRNRVEAEQRMTAARASAQTPGGHSDD